MGYELNEPATEPHSLICQTPLWHLPFFVHKPLSLTTGQHVAPMTNPQQQWLKSDKSHCNWTIIIYKTE